MLALFWLLLLVAGFGFGTLVGGWWAVPVLALVAGLVVPGRLRPLALIPAAAGLGWGLLLLRAARAEGFVRLTGVLGDLLPLPVPALVAATLLFPVVLAAGAALVSTAIRGGASLRTNPVKE